MTRAKTPDEYFNGAAAWRDELIALRRMLLAAGLEETLKWGAPVYVRGGKNIVGVAAFKNHFGLWFFQGALLSDKARTLSNAQPGKTQAMRQWRMQSPSDVKPAQIRAYVKEAITHAEAGRAVKPARNKPLSVPPELARALRADKKAQAAFKALSPGKQREYADYIAEAKLAATKERRLDKILPMIARGAGLNDKYRK